MDMFIFGLLAGLVIAAIGKAALKVTPAKEATAAKHMDKLAGKADKQLKVVQQVQNELAEIDRKSAETVKTFSQKIQDLLN